MQKWALHDAKARFSEVVRLAMHQEPQTITFRGEEAVVVVSKREYETLLAPKPSFLELMQSSPLQNISLELGREQSLPREVDL